MNSPVQCPACKTTLPYDAVNRGEPVPCPGCSRPVQAELFPAIFRRIDPGATGEALMVEGESSCFYHPQKKAVVPCESCGRFLCALCDCELHGQHFCPSCIEAGRTRGKIEKLENRRMLYDNIALCLAVLPIVVLYFTIITAPMAIYIAVRHWNSPLSVVHRTKIRYVIALIVAGLQIAGWGLGIFLLVTDG